jgi:BMFP domain-containing protein YqiC
MQTGNPIFDDLARVASGAFSTLSGMREEIETRIKERLERFAGEMDLATREELDAVKAMALKARAAQEEIDGRLSRLEASLAELHAKMDDAAGTAPAPRAARKRGADPGGSDAG